VLDVAAPGPDARVVLDVPAGYDLGATLRPYALGRRDRCTRFQGSSIGWRATRTPDGPGTGRYEHRGDTVVVSAWGPGAGWLAEHAADLLGLHDDVAGFDELVAGHPYLGPRWRQRPGWRFGRSHAVYEALLPTICGQKVTGLEAKRAWNGIVDRWGQQAPGPPGLRVPPRPERLADLGYGAFHPLGVERKRAEVIRAVAARGDELDALAGGAPADAEVALRRITGIGVWSAAEVRRLALGDADAVSYGDYHLPDLVSFSLLGRRDGTDELLAELVAPFAPHRGRVVRLLELTGQMPERRGPRMTPNGMRSR
jgi:3-methyladenine DNA glycosylase/8-oxoguanine DNA glycosylase